jgi:hypothetical protein
MEILLGLIATGVFSFLAGFMIAGVLKIDIKFSKKEDYAAKVEVFEALIADLEQKLGEAQTPVEDKKYHPLDMFPANLPRDYGLPRSLEEE